MIQQQQNKNIKLWGLHCPSRLWLGGKLSRALLASSRDLERPERAPRSPAGGILAPNVHATPLRAPQPRAPGKTLGRKKNGLRCAKKVNLVHTHTRLPFGERGGPRGETQAGLSHEENTNRQTVVLVV